MIEALIKVIKLSSEHRLSDLLSDYRDFENSMKVESKEVNNFMAEAFLSSSENIDTFKWFPSHKLLSFPSSNSLLKKTDIRKKFEEVRND